MEVKAYIRKSNKQSAKSWYALLKWVDENGIINNNTADKAKLSIVQKYRANTYNSKQLSLLLKISKGTPIERAVFLAANYALRRGEILGLRWEDVDFNGRIIHIRNTMIAAKSEIFWDIHL